MYSDYKPSGEKELSETLQAMERWKTSACLYGVRQMLTDPTGRRTTPDTILCVRKVWRDKFVFRWSIFAPRESDSLIEQACKELDFVRSHRFFHIKPYMFNSMQVLAILRWLETRFTDKSGIWTYVSVDLKKCALNSDFFKLSKKP